MKPTGTAPGRLLPAVQIDPGVAQIIRELADVTLVPDSATPTEALAAARAAFPSLTALMRGVATRHDTVLVTDHELPGQPPVPVRSYRPAGPDVTHDVLLFFHGGGWVAGGPQAYDNEMCLFADRLQMPVVSVDYRLAPEHPYPAAFDDCMTAVHRLHEDPTVGRLAVAGDSAGGNLAAAVAIACRDGSIPLAAQLLLYPALDPTQQHPSQDTFAEGYGLTKSDMASYWSAYLPQTALRTAPTAAPATSTQLRGLAPAVVVTAGFDPLRDEGDDYTARLAGDAVPTTHLENPTLAHGFLLMTNRVPEADAAVRRCLDALAHQLQLS